MILKMGVPDKGESGWQSRELAAALISAPALIGLVYFLDISSMTFTGPAAMAVPLLVSSWPTTEGLGP